MKIPQQAIPEVTRTLGTLSGLIACLIDDHKVIEEGRTKFGDLFEAIIGEDLVEQKRLMKEILESFFIRL